MTKYSAYKVEDFLLDESFIEWVLNNSEKEAIFWNAWIAAHPASVPVVNLAKKTLLALHIQPARQLTDEELNQMIGFVEAKTQTAQFTSRKSVFTKIKNVSFSYSIAAILVMGLIGGVVFFNKIKQTVHVQNAQAVVTRIKTIKNNSSISMLIKLADGSSAILKPGSSLTYPSIFTGKSRSVSLNGEAFFEIHKDASHPFFVNSGEWVTRVVGTSFTVKAFSSTKEYKVVVNTGKVCVSKKDKYGHLNIVKSNLIYLTPNQQLTYTVHKSIIKQTLEKPLMLSEVSKDIFTFNDTPFNKVIATLEQAYNINVIYNEKEMAGCPLTASLGDEHLLGKLDLICKTLNANYYINVDGQIIMHGKGCNAAYSN